MPPQASPSTSMANVTRGLSSATDPIQCFASSSAYGCGKRSRTFNQTFRLLAYFAIDGASSSAGARNTQIRVTSLIQNPGAGGGNRTRAVCLEGRRTTTMQRPQVLDFTDVCRSGYVFRVPCTNRFTNVL